MDYETYQSQLTPRTWEMPKLSILTQRIHRYIVRKVLVRASLADLNAAIKIRTGKPTRNAIVRAEAKGFNQGYNKARKDLNNLKEIL